MRAVMVKGTVVAMLAAVVLVPEASAAVDQVSASCRSGGFRGSFTLNYQRGLVVDDPISVNGGSGPYIGDSGTLDIRLSHVDAAGTEHTVYESRQTGVPAGRATYAIPDDVKLPSSDIGLATVSFSGGGSSCTAQEEIG